MKLLVFLMMIWAVTAPAQTDGVTAGAGSEDDPWLIDVDALLKQGFAVIVTDEDTIAVAGAPVDTIRVAAPRLRVSEVVKRVAAAMADAGRAIGPHTYTEMSRVTAWTDRHDPTKVQREVYVDLARINRDGEGEYRTTRLFQSEKRYKAGELVEEKTEEDITREWQDDVVQSTMAMPFGLLTANTYRYTILERTLIGEHLVFRIGFEPKNRFESGLAGEVWIDYSDFVIRRMEGAMVGPMPMPMIMRGVPEFTFTLRKESGHWVADELYAVVELNGALPKVPDSVEIQVKLDDYEFGVPVDTGEVAR